MAEKSFHDFEASKLTEINIIVQKINIWWNSLVRNFLENISESLLDTALVKTTKNGFWSFWTEIDEPQWHAESGLYGTSLLHVFHI